MHSALQLSLDEPKSRLEPGGKRRRVTERRFAGVVGPPDRGNEASIAGHNGLMDRPRLGLGHLRFERLDVADPLRGVNDIAVCEFTPVVPYCDQVGPHSFRCVAQENLASDHAAREVETLQLAKSYGLRVRNLHLGFELRRSGHALGQIRILLAIDPHGSLVVLAGREAHVPVYPEAVDSV